MIAFNNSCQTYLYQEFSQYWHMCSNKNIFALNYNSVNHIQIDFILQ